MYNQTEEFVNGMPSLLIPTWNTDGINGSMILTIMPSCCTEIIVTEPLSGHLSHVNSALILNVVCDSHLVTFLLHLVTFVGYIFHAKNVGYIFHPKPQVGKSVSHCLFRLVLLVQFEIVTQQ